ncbi:DeoR/GlpR family DNA-binding transcription regulator, partial [Endozoicomonas elysicola]
GSMQKQIALEVVKHIKDGSSVFIALGTTMEAIAHELACKKDLTIFTNSLKVANIIYENTDFDVIIPGGTVQRRNAGLVDRETESFVKEISVDYCLFTCGGVEKSGYLLGFYLQEIHILKMVLERSSYSFLVIDSEKVNKSAPIRITHLSEINSLFIDKKPSEGILNIARSNNIGVYIPEILNTTL